MTSTATVSEAPTIEVAAARPRTGEASTGGGEGSEKSLFPALLSELAAAVAGDRSGTDADESHDRKMPDPGVSAQRSDADALSAMFASCTSDAIGLGAGMPPAIAPPPTDGNGGGGRVVDALAIMPSEAGVEAQAGVDAGLLAASLKSRVDGRAGGEAAIVTAKIAVLRRETHLAVPAAPLLAADVADAIVEVQRAAQATGDGKAAVEIADADEPGVDLPPPRVLAAVARSREDGRGPSAAVLSAMPPPPTSHANRAPSADPVAAVAVPDVAAARRDAQAGVVQPQPPVQQIADRIVGELTAASPLARAQPPTPANAPQASALKVLHFQLQPPELGPITVRMSLKADSLDLRLEVGRHETVRLIQRDQESLSGLLRSAGYLIEAVAVRIADPAAAAMATGTAVLQQPPAQAEGGGWQADGRSAGAQGQEQRGGHAYTPNRNDTDEIRRTIRPDGDIYV